MYEIDKVKFGEFVSSLRKKKGMTQKELAGQLYISDKAVSKWERGLSVPDITLLVPLAEILGVSVTELLECEKIPKTDGLNMDKADDLVKKVIGLSGERVERTKIKKKNVWIYLCGVSISLLEIFGLYQIQEKMDVMLFPAFMMIGMAMLFGIYFWFFMREKLPAYYDENRISVYVDGIVHMNLSGVYFNNNNWRYIVKAFRIWSLVEMTIFPIVYTMIEVLLSDRFPMIGLCTMLILTLGGLFIPPYILGRKYQYLNGEVPEKNNVLERVLWILPMLLLLLWFSFRGIGTMRSVSIIGGSERAGRTGWSGEYRFIDGFIQRNLWTEEGENGFQILVEKEDGRIGFEIKDEKGMVIFEEENVETGNYEIEAIGKCRVRVTFDNYKGSFYIGE